MTQHRADILSAMVGYTENVLRRFLKKVPLT